MNTRLLGNSTFLILLLTIFNISFLTAQTTNNAQVMPLFQSDEMLNLTIEGDFNVVFSVKDDSTYFPATISFDDNVGINKSFEIEIRTRGNSRRRYAVCRFSPLRLRFPRSEMINTVFEDQRAIKLVTHCRQVGVFEQKTITEYLIYKAFNILTDSSFKVRPAIVNYVFADEKKDTVKKFAFFIERDKHVAERIGCIEIDSIKVHPYRLQSYHTSLMDMFQYMIGNTDYSTYEPHNIKLFNDRDSGSHPIAIPYDFDFSGLISASYSFPNSVLNIESVTQRVYRGYKKSPEIIYATIHHFNNKKTEIYQLFEESELLNQKEKKRIIKYLDKFYRIINKERLIKVEFLDNARVISD